MRSKAFLNTSLGILSLGFSGFAAYVAFSLSAIHLGGTPTCPIIFDMPACVIVFVCYVLITIAWGMVLANKQWRWAKIFFTIGFVPAFLLALIGSSGEILGFASCPTTETGFPKCFISLIFLMALAVGWIASSDSNKERNLKLKI